MQYNAIFTSHENPSFIRMNFYVLLSLSNGFVFLLYTLGIPIFLHPDCTFTCNNLIIKSICNLLYHNYNDKQGHKLYEL